MKYYFDDYSVHKTERELLYQGNVKKIDPMTFRVLVFMLENPKRLLSYDELIQEVWKSRLVSNSTLNATVSTVRRAIGDSGKRQKSIKTVSGRGYRFIAKVIADVEEVDVEEVDVEEVDVEEVDVEEDGVLENHAVGTMPQSSHSLTAATTLALPNQPSIAVMDILDMAGTQEGMLLAGGLTVGINSCLARLPHFLVIARASAASLSTSNLLPSEVGRHLGVRYLIYGHVERVAKQVHATISVVDVERNAEIWSEYYDRSLDDFFQMKGDILQSIVMAIDSTVEQAEIERAFLLPPANLGAWDLYYQALSRYHQTSYQSVLSVRALLLQAVSLDSSFSRAYAGLSNTHANSVVLGVEQLDCQAELRQAVNYAQKSIACCPRDAVGYRSLARAQLLLQEYDGALEASHYALRLNPNSVRGYLGHALICAHMGLDEEFMQSYNKVQRLSPFDPLQFAMQGSRAVSLVHQRQFDEAMAWAVRSAHHVNAYHSVYAIAAVCCELAGDSQQARHYVEKVLQTCPHFSIGIYRCSFQHQDKETRALFMNTLRELGVV